MKPLPRSVVYGLIILVAGAVLSWNVSRFVGAEAKIRKSEHINYLPSPEMARVMSFGHAGAQSKFQWINSFTYWQHQLDANEAAGREVFYRLYDNVITLDPYFLPFYEYALLTLGGSGGDQNKELGLMFRGLSYLPESRSLWKNLMAILVTGYDAEVNNPDFLESQLKAWAEAERAHQQRLEREHNVTFEIDFAEQAERWLKMIAVRHSRGLGQAHYWAEQLYDRLDKPQSTGAEKARETLREQIARFQLDRLQQQLDQWHVRYGPWCWWIALLAYVPVEPLESGLAPWLNPFYKTTTPLDPYGYAYTIHEGEIVSLGLEIGRFRRYVSETVNRHLEAQSRESGWFTSIEEVSEALPWLIDPPKGCRYRLFDGLIALEVPEPVTDAWDDEKLLHSLGIAVK